MSITANKVGRNLEITMEGVDGAFVVRPLPGLAGLQITDTYLNASSGNVTPDEWADSLIMAVDGARQNAITGRWEPVPEGERTNFDRINHELSQTESEGILMPAFFWQTILGVDGVNAYIEGGEGLSGTLKAAGALSLRLGHLARRTSPNSA